MRLRVGLVIGLIATISLAGCFEEGDLLPVEGTDTGGVGGNLTTDPGNETGGEVEDVDGNGTVEDNVANTPPVANLTADLLSGAAPLSVNFTINGTDADGDNLTWTLDVDGDGQADAEGTVPASFNHLFEVGVHAVNLTVSDGQNESTATVTIEATEASATVQPQVVNGEWVAGGPISCAQFAAGQDLHQAATLLEDVEFVTFDIRADTWGGAFAVTVTPATPAAGPFELDFYGADGGNLGFTTSDSPTSFDFSGTVPANATQAVFFACTPGGGTFVYTAQG